MKSFILLALLAISCSKNPNPGAGQPLDPIMMSVAPATINLNLVDGKLAGQLVGSEESISFGDIQQGSAATVTISFSAKINLSNLNFSGFTSGTKITQKSSSCPTSLLRNRSCSIVMQLDTSSLGAVSEEFSLDENNKYTITANVIPAPPVVPSAANLTMTSALNLGDFSGVEKTGIVSISNSSTVAQDLTIDSSALIEGFRVVSNSCPAKILGRRACQVKVGFSSVDVVEDDTVKTATLTLNSDKVSTISVNHKAPFVAEVTSVSLSPASLDFGTISAVTKKKVTITNTGVNLSGLFFGTLPTGVTVVNNTCSSSLLRSRSCSLEVQISPALMTDGPVSLQYSYGNATQAIQIPITATTNGGIPSTPIPAKIVKVSGDTQTANIGSTLTKSLKVKILDSTDAPLANFLVSFSAPTGTLSASSALTGADGTASVSYTLGTTLGSYSVRAYSDVLTTVKEVTFTHTAIEKDGVLDVAFSGDGVGEFPVNHGGISSGFAQSNNKVVTVGYSNGNPALVRYNEDGSRDMTFGVNGLANPLLNTINTTGASYSPVKAMVLSDDRIAIAGTFYDSGIRRGKMFVTLLTSNGAIDTSFNGGVYTFNFGTSDQFGDMSVTADSLILSASAYMGNGYEIKTFKLNFSGQLVPSFGTAGIISGTYGGQWGAVNSAAVFSDNTMALYTYGDEPKISKINSQGSVLSNVILPDSANAIATQPDGKLLVAIQVYPNHAIYRYNQDLTLDSSFGTNGSVSLSPLPNSYVMGIKSIGDKIVVSGYNSVYNFSTGVSTGTAFLQRLNSNGSLDTSFGASSLATYSSPAFNFQRGLGFDLAGRSLVGGTKFNSALGIQEQIIVRFTGTVTDGVTLLQKEVLLAVNENFSFTSVGGKKPYRYEVLEGAGTIDSASGAYIAGNTPGSSVVQVTDEDGKTSTVVITIERIVLKPRSFALSPLGTQVLTLSGSPVGAVTYSVSENNSGASITGNTYKAGAIGNVVDTITASDSSGNTSSIKSTVGAALVVSPTINVASNSTVTISPTGGNPPYSYSLVQASAIGSLLAGNIFNSGKNINAANFVEIVQITDANGAVVQAAVNVLKDNIPPSVAIAIPANNAIQIALNSTVEFNMSEDVQSSTVAISAVDELAATVSGTFSYSNKKIIWTPSNGFLPNKEYTLTLSGAKDLAGNTMSPYSLKFKSIDTIPPTIVGTFPLNNGLVSSADIWVSIEFSEPMAPATITASNVELRHESGSVINGTVQHVTASNKLLFKPDAPLSGVGQYTFKAFTDLTDIAGNELQTDYTLTFSLNIYNFTSPVQISSGTPLFLRGLTTYMSQSGHVVSGWGDGNSSQSIPGFKSLYNPGTNSFSASTADLPFGQADVLEIGSKIIQVKSTPSNTTGIRVRTWDNTLKDWGAETRVDTQLLTSWQTGNNGLDVSVGKNGHIAVLYRTGTIFPPKTSPDTTSHIVTFNPATNTWNTQLIDPTAPTGERGQISVDSTGKVFVAWISNTACTLGCTGTIPQNYYRVFNINTGAWLGSPQIMTGHTLGDNSSRNDNYGAISVVSGNTKTAVLYRKATQSIYRYWDNSNSTWGPEVVFSGLNTSSSSGMWLTSVSSTGKVFINNGTDSSQSSTPTGVTGITFDVDSGRIVSISSLSTSGWVRRGLPDIRILDDGSIHASVMYYHANTGVRQFAYERYYPDRGFVTKMIVSAEAIPNAGGYSFHKIWVNKDSKVSYVYSRQVDGNTTDNASFQNAILK